MITSRCGLKCDECEYKEATGCGGCIATNGRPFHGECRLAMCCQTRELVHCGQCGDFPCALLTEFAYDKEHGDDGERIRTLREWTLDGAGHCSPGP